MLKAKIVTNILFQNAMLKKIKNNCMQVKNKMHWLSEIQKTCIHSALNRNTQIRKQKNPLVNNVNYFYILLKIRISNQII